MTTSIQRIGDYYRECLETKTVRWQMVGLPTDLSQSQRFKVVLDHVHLHGKSLLDLGCGMGDLLRPLRGRHGETVTYTGVDILPEMVSLANRFWPGERFLQADVFAGELDDERFDVVFASGPFNIDLGNDATFLPRAIRKMLSLSRERTVFNLLHSRTRAQDDRLVYYVPEDVRKIVEPMAETVQIIDDYLWSDFTVICRPNSRQEITCT